MPLESEHFKGNDRLQSCLVADPFHVLEGDRGAHVALIQQALTILGAGLIDANEITREFYGPSTSRAVLKYKGPPRNILNTQLRQTIPDAIVGKRTIAWLDEDMKGVEKTPPSQFVCTNKLGEPHDHSKCRPLQVEGHLLTPKNPNRWGRMINIYGTYETDYLGFEDYSCNPLYCDHDGGPLRKLTYKSERGPGLEDNSVSDICLRSSPLYNRKDTHQPNGMNEIDEISRLSQTGCRITFAGEEVFMLKLLTIATIVEKVAIQTLKNNTNPSLGYSTSYAWVLIKLG
ncbi:peptidoglycan-binding domain-containing protein [Methylocella silvestris]|nr:hypothetical protein [Methylocella silvestris]